MVPPHVLPMVRVALLHADYSKERGETTAGGRTVANSVLVLAENLLQHRYLRIVDDLVEEGDPVDTELSVLRTETDEECINNSGR